MNLKMFCIRYFSRFSACVLLFCLCSSIESAAKESGFFIDFEGKLLKQCHFEIGQPQPIPNSGAPHDKIWPDPFDPTLILHAMQIPISGGCAQPHSIVLRSVNGSLLNNSFQYTLSETFTNSINYRAELSLAEQKIILETNSDASNASKKLKVISSYNKIKLYLKIWINEETNNHRKLIPVVGPYFDKLLLRVQKL